MRFLSGCLAIATLTALALPAAAESAISTEIGERGIQPTIDRLSALTAPTEADRFALGGLLFLRATESALQARWKVGLSDSLAMIPFLRLPVPENPAPQPFDPALITSIFRQAADGMEAARAALAPIPEGADFGVEIALSDLWFDINASGTRDPGEDLAEVAGPLVMGWRWAQRDPATPLPVVRFDGSDVAWLAAYTHLLSGLSEIVLAYDPTASITRVTEARAAMTTVTGTIDADDYGIGTAVDVAAIVLGALDQQPDAARLLSARDHLQSMIDENRRFWSAVERETDNDREWIPNDRQVSALGLEFPKGMAAIWQAVLADGEALLKGDLLIPYWRLGSTGGVNLGKVFTDPRPVDVAGWIQGWAALPYLESGRQISGENLNRFEALVMGESALFMVMLN